MQMPSGRLEVEDYKLLKEDADDAMLYNDLYRLKLYQGTDVTLEPGWQQKAFTVPEIHRAAFTGDLKELLHLSKQQGEANLQIKDGPKILQCLENFERNYVGFFVGTTPLMIASERGDDKAVKILLQNGALVNTADSVGLTAFAWACSSNRKSTCELLLSNRAMIDLREDRHGMSPLLLASRHNLTNMTKWLLDRGANVHSRDAHGMSALHFAAWNYNVELMECLVARGAMLNTKDRSGKTPLHLLTSEDSVFEPNELDRGINELEQASLELLLDRNYILSQKGVHIILDIQRSIPRGSGELPSLEEYYALHKLLTLGANANIQDKNGQTPLHCLASRLPKAVVVQDYVICTAPKLNQSLLVQMTILQRFGTNVDRADLHGHTAIDICVQGENWLGVKLLRKYTDNDIDIPNQKKIERGIWRKGMQYCEKERELEMAVEKLTDDIFDNCTMTLTQHMRADLMATARRELHEFLTDTVPNGLRAWFL
ncbi:ankyrin repeat and protein kinase domain-containing protein 1-like [Argopecten irradians]|uniref:ankyrin repeat and protein kinase domain-containing protein 1-like n=1 Tax=Argopecten irradians TaxID=31199 RepID=UPI0037241030